VSVYLDYSNQSYWDRPDSERWNLSLSRYFDAGPVKNLSMSLNLFQTQQRQEPTSKGMFLTFSVPLGRSGSLSSSFNRTQNTNSYSTRYSDRINERNNYQLAASDTSVSGFLSHAGDRADVDLSAGIEKDSRSSLSVSARGGGTLTKDGAALHRSSSMGGTRLMVDTSGVADVPIRGYGTPTRSNGFGKAVISDISSFYRTSASVDLESLPSNIEATQSVTELTLTEGAIGYRTLAVISGEKAMAVLHLPDGSVPPFGASVKNDKQQDTGIVNDEGSVYLSGIQPGSQMTVSWGSAERCSLSLPKELPADGLASTLNLQCQPIKADSTPASAVLPDVLEKKAS